jgi:hypothetical protein
MGCSSGKTKISIRSLKLKSVGLPSVDKFIDETEDVIERFAKLTDDIEKKRLRLDSVTGFPKDSGLKKSVIGILLFLYAAAAGDKTKVKIEISPKKIKIKVAGVNIHKVDDYIDAIDDYFDEIVECFESKIPKIIKEMTDMGLAVAGIVANVAGEIEELGAFEKASVVVKMA